MVNLKRVHVTIRRKRMVVVEGSHTTRLTPLSSSISLFTTTFKTLSAEDCTQTTLQGFQEQFKGSPPTPSNETGEISSTPEINPPVGDFSRWELERLYVYNLAVLEHQWKYTKMLEKNLLKMEQESVSKKPSKLEVYQRFLEFVVEPSPFPDSPVVNFPELSTRNF